MGINLAGLSWPQAGIHSSHAEVARTRVRRGHVFSCTRTIWQLLSSTPEQNRREKIQLSAGVRMRGFLFRGFFLRCRDESYTGSFSQPEFLLLHNAA